MKKTLYFGTLCLLSLLASCQAPLNQPQTNVLPNSPMLRQQSAQRQIQRQDLRVFQQPVPVTVEPQRLIFQGPQPDLKTNQVLMGRSQNNQDFLRRVRSIQPVGNQLIVETTQATLFDAFQELDFSGARLERAATPIALQAHRFNIGGIVDIVLDLGLKPDFSDAQLRLKNNKLFVRLAPKFELDAQVRSEFRFIGSRPINETPLQPIGNVSFNAARFPVWVGPVPLMFHLKPGAGLDLGHRADGRLLLATELQGDFKASVEMEAALGDSPVTRTDSDYHVDGKMLPPELHLTGSARARVYLPTVHVDSEIAGLVGPFIEARPYVDGQYLRRLSITPTQTTAFSSVNSHLGLKIDAGLTPTRLFGKDLTHELRFKILDKQLKELYRKETTEVLPNGQIPG